MTFLVAGAAAAPFAAPHRSYASGNLAAFTREHFESGACISKVPKCFRTQKAIAKSETLSIQRCFTRARS